MPSVRLLVALLLGLSWLGTTVPPGRGDVVAGPPPPRPAYSVPLTLEDRVACQTALEQVSWQHRIWPQDNPGPKPPLSAVLPPDAIRARVEEGLRQSAALAAYWGRSLTHAQLQAELDRMAVGSQQPEVLAELFAALGNDPYLAAECLARPALADRLLREEFVRDTARGEDEGARVAPPPAAAEFASLAGESGDQASFAAWWAEAARGLPAAADEPGGRYALPRTAAACTEGTWSPTTSDGAPSSRYNHTAVWTGSEMIVWGGYVSSYLNTGGRYNPATDTWLPTALDGAPAARSGHTAVWTGSEMIVWGGSAGATGGRYNPTTDTWVATATTGAPSSRNSHTAIWTGSRMIVWGGTGGRGASYLDTGAAYDPADGAAGSWAPIASPAGVVGGRNGHTAIWTGSRMIVWGGATSGGPYSNTGGQYDPAQDTWSATSIGEGVPPVRESHTAVWTGSAMIVWGGYGLSGYTNTGGRYDPAHDTWAPTSTAGDVPAGRRYHVAVWTGSEMIVWGGFSSPLYFNSGGRYDPATDTWSQLATNGAPSARELSRAVWTGSEMNEMIVWGGRTGGTNLATGGRYCPVRPLFAAAGTITTGGGTPLAGVTVATDGASAITDAAGTYQLAGLLAGSYTLTPSLAGYTFSPPSRTIALGPDAAGLDFTGTLIPTPTPTASPTATATATPTATATSTSTATAAITAIATATATGTPSAPAPTTTATPTSTPPGGSGARTWYFAEGNTGTGFDEYLTILNPGSATVAVTTTYFLADGGPVAKTLSVPASSRATVAVHDSELGVGRDQVVSAKVEGSGTIVVERPMYFSYGSGWTGGHDALGAPAPSTAWYFAEGYTGDGFDEYLTLQNPNSAAAGVTITYYLTGGAPVVKSLSVPAYARTTVVVHDPGFGVGRGLAVSAKVESDRPIVAERPMYFDYHGWTGGHVALGATAPNTAWYFAEGYTGPGFDEYLALLNPNGAAAQVTLTYFLAGGAPVVKSIGVPANSRYTVAVHDTAEGVGRNQAVSAKVESSLPIVAERPMYFSYGAQGWTGGLVALGAAIPATTLYFAEGYTGAGFDEYLTLQNPNSAAASVTITYYLGSGGPVVKSLTVPANSRYTVAVHDTAEGVGRNQAVSAKVESSLPIVAERPIYFSYGPAGWTGGHVVLGYAP